MRMRESYLKIFCVGIILLFFVGTSVPTVSEKEHSKSRTSGWKEYLPKDNKHIIIDATDFCDKNDQLCKTIIFFKSDVTVEITNIEIIDFYENLNGLYASIPYSLAEYLKHSWFTDYVVLFEQSSASGSGSYYCQDTLDWGVDDIDAEKVWGTSEGSKDVAPDHVSGEGIKVCLIDSGIDTDHDDLLPNYKGGIDYFDGGTPEDTYGHGTACAGVISAIDNQWGTIGVAPKIDLYVVRAGNDEMLSPSAINAGIYWAIDQGMDIISMSHGSHVFDEDMRRGVEEAYRRGIIVVAGAGNENSGHLAKPAAYISVLGVGSVEQYNGEYVKWVGPNGRGSNYDDTINIFDYLDFVAPGGTEDIYTTTLNNGHSNAFGGTSAATAHVAGVCALMLENAEKNNQQLSPGDIRHILQESAQKDCFAIDANQISGHQGDEIGYVEKYHGSGLVNVRAAIDYSFQYILTDTDGDGLTDGEEKAYKLNFLDSDSDGDGMPDGWEFAQFARGCYLDPCINDATSDADEDGLTNIQEYQGLTNPVNSDTDNDGLTDGEEVNIYGTNPFRPDTDYDGLSDSWEVANGYDPLDPADGSIDTDGDGIGNGDETSIYNTDYLDPDTDNDGLTDGEEVYGFTVPTFIERKFYTDPTNPDTDGDGLTDGEEKAGFDIAGVGERYTDPTDPDTDGDGLDDRMEVAVCHTDPRDTDTDDDGYTDYEEFCAGTDPTDPTDYPGGGGWLNP